MNKVLSDERLGAKLRVTKNRCVLFDSLTYIYNQKKAMAHPNFYDERTSCHPIQSVIILVINKSGSRFAVDRFCLSLLGVGYKCS